MESTYLVYNNKHILNRPILGVFMTWQGAASTSTFETEFSVYVYNYADDIEDGHTDWKMMNVFHCVQEAVNQAQKLHDSREFKKVEIKKKFFDEKYGRLMDKTYKVFQNEKRMSRRSGIMALFGFSCFAGMGVVALPFLFGI